MIPPIIPSFEQGDTPDSKHRDQIGAAACRKLTTLLAVMYQAPTREWLGRYLTREREMHGLHWPCGSGEHTFLIASLLDERSTILGIDADPVLMEVAGQEQKRREESRVRFAPDGPECWQSGLTHDFIYTRFGVRTFTEQPDRMRSLGQRLAPKGLLLAEVMSFSGFTAYPYNHAFGRAAELIGRLEERPNDTPRAWRDLFHRAGFTGMEITRTSPAFLPREHNRILSLSLEFFREALLRRRMAVREELNALLLELRQYEQQEDTLIGRPGALQIVARKNESS